MWLLNDMCVFAFYDNLIKCFSCRSRSECQWRDTLSPVEIYRTYSQYQILVLVQSHSCVETGDVDVDSDFGACHYATSTSGILEGQFVTTLHH
jgi:hypothetical protein